MNFKKAERIRLLYSTGKFTQNDLSYLFGVHRGHLSRVINYKHW